MSAETKTEPAWRRIRLAGLHRLLAAPGALRWQWETAVVEGRKRLLLRTPRGVVWRFRLNRGAWVRRELDHRDTEDTEK